MPPFNGAGVFSVYTPGTPYVTGTTISSTVANSVNTDFATGLSTAITKDGQTTVTANLPMAGFKHTGVGTATVGTQYLRADQAISSTLNALTTVSGTNTITANASIAPSAYAYGQVFTFIAAATNTAAVTLNISSLGAKNIYKRMSGGVVALVANDLIINEVYSVTYDGTQFVLNEQRSYSHGADIASASTINLDTSTGDCVDITGTTTITAITLAEGEQRITRFTGILILTNGASLVNLSATSITTAVGDYAIWRGYASGVVRMIAYSRANGLPIGGGASYITLGTPQASTSGSVISFTIPTWVHRVTVGLTGCSTNGTQSKIIRIGTGGVVDTSGYTCSQTDISATVGTTTATAFFQLNSSSVAARAESGTIILDLINSSTNTWLIRSSLNQDGFGVQYTATGRKSLSGTLDIISVIAGGADTWDAGEINITYE